MSVETELQDLTGVKQNRREKDSAYLERIVKALDDVSDSKYNKLSKDAQAWAEEATAAYNAEDEIPAFPEAEDGEDEADEAPRSRRTAKSRPAEDDEAEDDATESEDDEPEDAEGEPADQSEDEDMPTQNGGGRSRRKTAPAPSKRGATSSSRSAGRSTSAKTGSSRPGTALTYVRELLVSNPDITVAELSEKAKAKGHAVSTQTLNTTRSGFRQDVRALQEAGLLKKKLV